MLGNIAEIEVLMANKKLNVTMMAHRAGVAVPTMSYFLTAIRAGREVRPRTLQRVAKALGCNTFLIQKLKAD